MSIATGLAKAGAKARSAFSAFVQSKPAKYLATGGALGGGSYLAATGVSRGIDEVNEASGLDALIKLVNPEADEQGAKGAGTLVGVALVLGVVALFLFVFAPKHQKNRASRG